MLQIVIKSPRQTAREEEGNKKLKIKLKTTNKMALVSPDLSIITLNMNRLNSSLKKEQLNGWKTRFSYNLSKRHIQAKSERIGRDFSCKCKPKYWRGDYTYIR